jgi:hypothetical protein
MNYDVELVIGGTGILRRRRVKKPGIQKRRTSKSICSLLKSFMGPAAAQAFLRQNEQQQQQQQTANNDDDDKMHFLLLPQHTQLSLCKCKNGGGGGKPRRMGRKCTYVFYLEGEGGEKATSLARPWSHFACSSFCSSWPRLQASSSLLEASSLFVGASSLYWWELLLSVGGFFFSIGGSFSLCWRLLLLHWRVGEYGNWRRENGDGRMGERRDGSWDWEVELGKWNGERRQGNGGWRVGIGNWERMNGRVDGK